MQPRKSAISSAVTPVNGDGSASEAPVGEEMMKNEGIQEEEEEEEERKKEERAQ